ncbi:hypothetical protein D3C77_472910 [compost metagenome]
MLVDVCNVLELGNPSQVKTRLDEGVISNEVIQTNGGRQRTTIINEDGLYDVILESRKPEARKFRKWVTGEVLPSIRKTGGYVNDDEHFINTYLTFADDQTRNMFRSTLATVRNQNKLIQEQQQEISYKEDVIIGLVDEIDLADKRQILNRVVRKAGTDKVQSRWNELYNQFEMKYHINLKRKLEAYNAVHKPKLKNKLDYIDKVLNKLPELYEIACKIYESDIKELISEMYQLN